jgi:Family of unknown function (DUF6256)
MDVLPSRLTVLRAVLPPLIAAYVVFVAMVILRARQREDCRTLRRHETRGIRKSPPSIVGTTLGGYATFLVIVVVFHVWLARERDALPSAASGGAFLCGVFLGVAAVYSFLLRGRTGRR